MAKKKKYEPPCATCAWGSWGHDRFYCYEPRSREEAAPFRMEAIKVRGQFGKCERYDKLEGMPPRIKEFIEARLRGSR